MRALLLAAGLGTRLRPVTDTVPKCLVDINGRPLLDYWIELLGNAGITEMLANLHYLPDAVRRYIANCRHPVRITAVYEEKLLGTGGTLLANRAFFQDRPSMLVHADNLSRFSVRDFIRRFDEREPGVEITMMTFDAPDPKQCGIVELDRRGIVTAFHEKVETPPGNLANGAVYILSPPVMDFLAGLGKHDRFQHRGAAAFPRAHQHLPQRRLSPRHRHAVKLVAAQAEFQEIQEPSSPVLFRRRTQVPYPFLEISTRAPRPAQPESARRCASAAASRPYLVRLWRYAPRRRSAGAARPQGNTGTSMRSSCQSASCSGSVRLSAASAGAPGRTTAASEPSTSSGAGGSSPRVS